MKGKIRLFNKFLSILLSVCLSVGIFFGNVYAQESIAAETESVSAAAEKAEEAPGEEKEDAGNDAGANSGGDEQEDEVGADTDGDADTDNAAGAGSGDNAADDADADEGDADAGTNTDGEGGTDAGPDMDMDDNAGGDTDTDTDAADETGTDTDADAADETGADTDEGADAEADVNDKDDGADGEALIGEEELLTEEESTTEEEEEALMPAVTLSGQTASVRVTVEAPEGAFPEGVEMEVSDADKDGFLAAAEKELPEEYEAVDAVAVDITFYDADGEETEPEKEVEVTFSGISLEGAAGSQAAAGETGAAADGEDADACRVMVFHVGDDGEAEAIADDVPIEDGEVSFRASEFTVYGALLSTVSLTAGAEETGNFTVTGGIYNTDYSYADNALTILTGTALTISTTAQTSDNIVVNTDVCANITLAGVDIVTFGGEQSSSCPLYMRNAGESTITLKEDTKNTLDASDTTNCGPGIWAPDGKLLTIKGDGELTAKGGAMSAGIGGSDGSSSSYNNKITIDGGTVTATGGDSGAGIGSGYSEYCDSCSNVITINGGTVTATGGNSGAGIGSGYSEYCDSCSNVITISGGTVTATGGDSGAGIGSGYSYSSTCGSDITINGGTVTATGGSSGAGIGAGGSESGSNLTSSVTVENGAVVETDSVSTGTTMTYTCGIVSIGDETTVYGNVTLTEDLTVAEGSGLIIAEDADLTVAGGVTLTVSQGASLTVSEEASLTISEGASLIISDNATLTVSEDATLTNEGTVINSGEVTNSGTIANEDTGTLENSGTVTNDGTITNSGTLTNSSTVTNNSGGTITNSGTLTNNSTITNNGTIVTNEEISGTVEGSGEVIIETSDSGDSDIGSAGSGDSPSGTEDGSSDTGDSSSNSDSSLSDSGDSSSGSSGSSSHSSGSSSGSSGSVSGTGGSSSGAGVPYADVPVESGFYRDVQFVYDNGLMQGVTDAAGNVVFDPYAPMSRAGLAQVLYGMEGAPTVDRQAYLVTAGYAAEFETESFYDAAVWSGVCGILAIYEDGGASAGVLLTREQLAQAFYHYAVYKGYEPYAAADENGASAALSEFSDTGDISEGMHSALEWAFDGGLMAARPDGTLSPKEAAVRTEIAAMLRRFIGRYGLERVTRADGVSMWVKPEDDAEALAESARKN